MPLIIKSKQNVKQDQQKKVRNFLQKVGIIIGYLGHRPDRTVQLCEKLGCINPVEAAQRKTGASTHGTRTTVSRQLRQFRFHRLLQPSQVAPPDLKYSPYATSTR